MTKPEPTSEDRIAQLESQFRRARRQDRAVLLSWGLAVLTLATLFSFWTWSNQREQARAMCGIMQIITSGPAPVEGPAGDRGRAVLARMQFYERVAGCDRLLPE